MSITLLSGAAVEQPQLALEAKIRQCRLTVLAAWVFDEHPHEEHL